MGSNKFEMAISVDDPAIAEAFSDVCSDQSETNWASFGLTKGRPAALEFLGKGTQGFNEMAASLDQSRVSFVVMNVKATDDRGSTVSTRYKIVYITYLGENMSVMARGRVSTQQEDVHKAFSGVQIFFEYDAKAGKERDDPFHYTDIGKKLLASGGAHKPQYYDFGP